MKKIGVFLLSILVSSFATAQQLYDERIYIYSTGDLSSEGHEEACDEGLAYIASKWGFTGVNANVFVKAKLYSVETRAHNGKLKNDKVQEIGEILACQDWQTYLPDTNIIPVYYEITVGGRTYRAEGAMTLPSVPVVAGGGQLHYVPGYLPPEIYMGDIAATILPMSPGQRGGVLTVNGIFDFAQDPDDDYESSAIHVLRITVPAKN
jgi:hypothetical protein